jgi:hypothetical protein
MFVPVQARTWNSNVMLWSFPCTIVWGECLCCWPLLSKLSFHEGPKKIYRIMQTIKIMDRFTSTQKKKFFQHFTNKFHLVKTFNIFQVYQYFTIYRWYAFLKFEHFVWISYAKLFEIRRYQLSTEKIITHFRPVDYFSGPN